MKIEKPGTMSQEELKNQESETDRPQMSMEEVTNQLNVEIGVATIRIKTMDLLKSKLDCLTDLKLKGYDSEDVDKEIVNLIGKIIKLPA